MPFYGNPGQGFIKIKGNFRVMDGEKVLALVSVVFGSKNVRGEVVNGWVTANDPPVRFIAGEKFDISEKTIFFCDAPDKNGMNTKTVIIYNPEPINN
jgi:hypothetical protein